jgi:hypothetical protein
LSEDGEFCRSTLDANNVVEHMRQVLDAARSNGTLVFITLHHHWRKVVDVDVTPPRTLSFGAFDRSIEVPFRRRVHWRPTTPTIMSSITSRKRW